MLAANCPRSSRQRRSQLQSAAETYGKDKPGRAGGKRQLFSAAWVRLGMGTGRMRPGGGGARGGKTGGERA